MRSISMPHEVEVRHVAELGDDHHDPQPDVRGPDAVRCRDVGRDEGPEDVHGETARRAMERENRTKLVSLTRLQDIRPPERRPRLAGTRLGDEDVEHGLQHAAEAANGEQHAVDA